MTRLSAPAIVTAVIAALIIFIFKFAANRQHVRRLQEAGVPMPEFHPVFGHLLALKEAMQALPRNAVVHVAVRRIATQFPNGVFYLNLWPFSVPMLIVSNPYVASQVEAAFLAKPAEISANLDVINGGPSLVTMHGDTWRKWRSLLNPGFAAGYMNGLAPAVAEEVAAFCGLLRQRARRGDLFQLEEYTLRLTFDIIARVTLDVRLHYQTEGSGLAHYLRRQVYWSPFGTTFNPIRRYLSPRPLVQMYNSFRMNRYLSHEIDKRFEEIAASRKTNSHESHARDRSVISLAMDKYLDEIGEKGEISKSDFKTLAISQLRMFLYTGHDTTSSTLLYCLLLLSRHPEVMAKVRAEHEQVFGPDQSTEQLLKLIKTDPMLLNHIPYTLAVTKEVLRIFPPAGSMRLGRSDLTLTDEYGHQYPTEGCNIWVLMLAMHNSPSVFLSAEKFLPERWLVGPDDPLYPKKASFRAFEHGPRNCIGQTLAMLELRVALVMTVRTFDITPAYEEWDERHPKKGVRTVDGERVYQAEMGGGGAHPVDGFPVRITIRD